MGVNGRVAVVGQGYVGLPLAMRAVEVGHTVVGFDLDKSRYGLVPVHCDVWEGFIFVNFAREPERSLREFLGPMVTAIEDYPFGVISERFYYRANVGSNWKLFLDAFQEFYHAPVLHAKQSPFSARP